MISIIELIDIRFTNELRGMTVIIDGDHWRIFRWAWKVNTTYKILL